MAGKKTVVRVRIGDEDYSLKSDRSEDYTRAVAQHVDKALEEVRSSGTVVATHKSAVLAALAITDELLQARNAEREMAVRINKLTAQIARLLPPTKR
jgi:cell division protein ZapA